MVQSLVFGEHPSSWMKAMPLISLVSGAFLGFLEINGKHLQYSKFWNLNSQSKSKNSNNHIRLSSKTGMLIFYTPAFLAAAASFLLFPGGGLRFLLLKLALTLHFFKRILEVLFIHKYSGGTALDSTILISATYSMLTVSIIYFQHLTQGLPDPSVDLKYLGVLVFLLGISGNFYHHHLLSKLRKKGDRGYKIPRGGLFSLVVCPHYLFEILALFGISLISQTVYTFCSVLGLALYLTGRSYVTRKWYLSKFENFPREVRALIPYVF